MSDNGNDPYVFTPAETYEMYRKRIAEEDRLISERMLWLILSEPMLFTGLGLAARSNVVSTQPGITGGALLLYLLIATTGVVVAAISFISVRAAQNEINFLCTRYKTLFPSYWDNKTLLHLTGQSKHHTRGHWLPNALPFMVGFLWLVVAIFFILRKMGVPEFQ